MGFSALVLEFLPEPGPPYLLLAFVPDIWLTGNVSLIHIWVWCVTALQHLVSTSTLVFLTSAAGPPVAAAASLMPFSDGRNAGVGFAAARPVPQQARKYPLLKRESSISLESASSLISQINGTVGFCETPRVVSCPFCTRMLCRSFIFALVTLIVLFASFALKTYFVGRHLIIRYCRLIRTNVNKTVNTFFHGRYKVQWLIISLFVRIHIGRQRFVFYAAFQHINVRSSKSGDCRSATEAEPAREQQGLGIRRIHRLFCRYRRR